MKTNRGLLIASVIAFAIMLSLSNAARSQQETADQFVERVMKAIKADEWGRAKGGIRHALALEPNSPHANFVAAQVYFHEGALSMAVDAVTKAVEAQPVYPEAHFLRARCFLGLGNRQKAREELHIALGQSSPPFPAYRLLGEIDIGDGNYTAAIESFETAIRAAQMGDEQEATQLQKELQDLQKLVENMRRFASLEAEQNSPDVVHPIPLNSPQPRYTEEARRLKLQGPVGLAVLVTQSGDVDSVLLLRPLGAGLDEEAIDVGRRLKFSPAQRNGKPVPYWTKVVVEFNLR